MPETLTEREVADILRVKPGEAAEVMERDGVRLIRLSDRRFRVDSAEFVTWLRGAAARLWSPEETRTP